MYLPESSNSVLSRNKKEASHAEASFYSFFLFYTKFQFYGDACSLMTAAGV